MDGGSVEVVSRTVFVEDEIVRPSDTIQYTAGDVVADSTGVARPFKFSKVARSPGRGGIIQSTIIVDSAAQATKPDLELYLFNMLITMQADNAAWNPANMDMEFFIGWISLPTTSFKICGANGTIQTADKGLAFSCARQSSDIFGVLVVRNAYTPVSAEQFRIKLAVLQD